MSPTRRQVHTLTPFDMAVLNDLDRFHLAAGVIDRMPALGPRAAYAKQAIHDKLIEHKQYIAARLCANCPRSRRSARRRSSARTRPAP